MKRATLIVALAAAVTAVLVAGCWYSQPTAARADSRHARRVLHYVDPMHPAYTSPVPGFAPDCGMPLEPVYEDAAPSHESAASPSRRTTLTLSPQQQRLIGVRVAEVEQTGGRHALRLFGRVAVDETRTYQINVGVDGYIREMSGATTASRVEKDQWLATFSSPEARQPLQAFLVALDVLDRAQKAAESTTQIGLATAAVQQTIDRLLTIGMSPVQVDDIRRSRVVPANLKITAPASGFVIVRSVTTGQQVKAGTELFRIADLRTIWIDAAAFGVDAEAVRAANRAEVMLPGRARSVRARVTNVLPQFDQATQSLKIRLEAENPGYVLRPDMLVDVDIHVSGSPAITVPRDALVQTGLKAIVFVEWGAGRFEPRSVETGRRFADRVEIVRGLEAGDRVAVAGTFLLDSERRLRMTLTSTGAGQ